MLRVTNKPFVLNAIMPSVVILNVIMLSVVMLSIIILSVMAPLTIIQRITDVQERITIAYFY
jgi:hypothetical protein